MKNNLLIITSSLGAGGLEKMVTKVANYYSKKDWKVTICCLMSREKEIFYHLNKNISVEFFEYGNSKRKPIISWLRYLRKISEKCDASIVLSMTLKIAALCALSIKHKNKRFVMREISDPKSKVRSRLLDSILFLIIHKIDALIMQTKWEASCYPKSLQKKCKIIPNPCNVEQIQWNQNSKTFFTMGRLYNIQKRHDILIESFSIFANKHPDYKLIIYGDGPDYDFDIKLIKKLKLETNIQIHKPTPKVINLIKNNYLFVMTSDFEGMSNALLECYLMGIPCLSTDWPGVTDIISHETDGIIAKRNDIQEISKCFEMMISDKDKCLRLSQNAKKRWVDFEENSVLDLYAKVIEG